MLTYIRSDLNTKFSPVQWTLSSNFWATLYKAGGSLGRICFLNFSAAIFNNN